MEVKGRAHDLKIHYEIRMEGEDKVNMNQVKLIRAVLTTDGPEWIFM